jgi:hypothetical protein
MERLEVLLVRRPHNIASQAVPYSSLDFKPHSACYQGIRPSPDTSVFTQSMTLRLIYDSHSPLRDTYWGDIDCKVEYR